MKTFAVFMIFVRLPRRIYWKIHRHAYKLATIHKKSQANQEATNVENYNQRATPTIEEAIKDTIPEIA